MADKCNFMNYPLLEHFSDSLYESNGMRLAE